MKRLRSLRQRGVALIALVAVLAIGASALLIRQLNAESGTFAAVRKQRNAEVLLRAKQALIGYVAAQAVKTGENNPGAMPCPENPGDFDSTTGNDGRVGTSCGVTTVGRFPWRTLGVDQLVDASGEPLWYVVSPGWGVASGSNTSINSNSVGRLTVDGTVTTPIASPGKVNYSAHGLAVGDTVSFTTGGTLPTGITAGATYYVIASGLTADVFEISATSGGAAINFTGTTSGPHNVHRNQSGTAKSVVALIIAPGPAFTVAAATGCAAVTQARSSAGTPDWRNYLECENATSPADGFFVTSGPSGSFNDQVLAITQADVMPGIEAAIATRIKDEILPALQTVFTPLTWGFSGSNPVLPYAAAFASPGPGTGTSGYQGAAGTHAGLLPFNLTQGCTESASDLRCTTVTTGTSGTTGLPAFLVFSKSGIDVQTAGAGSIRTQSTCSWASSVYTCTGEYNQPSISVTVSLNVTNVTMGLRTPDLAKVTCTAVDDVGAGIGTQTVPCTVSVALQADGSATFTATTGALPDIVGSGWGTYANYKINIDRAAVGDHALLSSTDGTTGWFVRNEWYRLLYYAVSPSNTAVKVATERSCSALPADCLTVANLTPSTSTSAHLVLAGRSINGSARPSATIADYFEFGNTKGTYERQTVTPAIATMYTDTGTANAYAVSVASLAAGANLQFRALNANTGTSTLDTPATGTKSLLNADGSNLSASTIQANAAVQVVYDGTQFLLLKRPFNDRVVAIGSN